MTRWLAVQFLAALCLGCGANLDRGVTPHAHHSPVADTPLSKKYELRLTTGRGKELAYFVREPRRGRRPLPAVFILAGVETGRDSLDLIDDRDDLVLLSMNYPRAEAMGLTGLGLLLAPMALRRMASETLEGGVVAIDYLSKRPDVDQERIILLGVSVGSVLITALAAQDQRADAV
ncbi:MAG: hypothetical protein ACREJ6_03620, partial [Candidatus Methylomirabilis sp.]